MGQLFAALRLRPPKSMLVAATAEAREMELVEDRGGRWVDREVDEAEVAAFMAGATGTVARPPVRTGTVARPPVRSGGSVPPQPADDAPPAEPPKPAGSALQIPVSLSIELKKTFKYLELEKLKIEGELKFEAEGEKGVVKTADVLGVALDKGKLAPSKKVEVDLKKLKDLLLGQVTQDAKDARVQVEPKLECKIGPGELNVALSISVSIGAYAAALKFVAVGKEAGKEMKFASFQVSPGGLQFKDKKIEVAGTKGKLSGKLLVGVVVKPAWGAIGAEVATKVGRPVSTTLVQALTAETAIAAGFVAGAVAQVFAYAKSVSEWRDVRDAAQAAECGWQSFYAGFGSAYGLKWRGGGVAGLYKEGAAAAKALLDARLQTTRREIAAERGALPAGFDAEWTKTMRDIAAKNPDGLGRWIERNFRRQILDGFVRAWVQEHADDTMFETNHRALRTLLGIGG